MVGGIYLYKTYALYEEKKDFNVLKGIVPNFIEYIEKYVVDGNDTTSFPAKNSGYTQTDIYCSGLKNYSWDTENWKVSYSKSDIISKNVSCTISFKKVTLNEVVNLGDYVSYTPSSTSYIISKDLTGYTVNQTINPSELNLWRVIKKNDDGSIEVVSEYVSNNAIYFSTNGYGNYMYTLNKIASSYESVGLTSGSRYVGALFEDKETNTNYPNGVCYSSNVASSLTENSNCSEIDIIKNTLGSLIANTPNGTSADYFYGGHWDMAYYKNGKVDTITRGVMIVSSDGIVNNQTLSGSVIVGANIPSHLRIVVSFDSVTIIGGNGNKDNPYKVN